MTDNFPLSSRIFFSEFHTPKLWFDISDYRSIAVTPETSKLPWFVT